MGRRAHDGLRKRCGCGRGRRKWPRSPHSWHFNFCHDGRAYRFSLDVVARARGEQPPGTMAEASGWRDRIRGEIRAGTLGDPKAIPQPVATQQTLGDVADAYLAQHVRAEGRREAARHLMEWYVAALRRAEVPTANGGRSDSRQSPSTQSARRMWRRSAADGSDGAALGRVVSVLIVP